MIIIIIIIIISLSLRLFCKGTGSPEDVFAQSLSPVYLLGRRQAQDQPDPPQRCRCLTPACACNCPLISA